MEITKDDIIKALEEMKLSELNELVKEIENRFGILATAPSVSNTISNNEESTNVVQTEFDVILKEVGQSKVAVIKLISKITGKGLMDAKSLVEKLPAVIKSKIKQEEADDLKDQLVAIGALVELK